MRQVSFNESRHSFDEEWPDLARRLESFLAAKRVDTWLRADVVQETATRVYRKWPGLDHSRPLWNLVVTIALGVLVDERRKASRVDLVPFVPQPEVEDVENRALHRVQLRITHSALDKLRADQRQVLLAEIGEAAALEGSRNRINVLRLRARLALRGELGPLAPAGVAMRVRSLRTAIERRLAEWNQDNHAVLASMASVAVAATLVITDAGLGTIEPQRQNPQEVVLSVLPIDDVHVDAAVPPIDAIKRVAPTTLSRAKDQATETVPPFAICAAEVCSGPEDPLVVGKTRSGDVLRKVEESLREGERQLSKKERKLRRLLTDPPLP